MTQRIRTCYMVHTSLHSITELQSYCCLISSKHHLPHPLIRDCDAFRIHTFPGFTDLNNRGWQSFFKLSKGIYKKNWKIYFCKCLWVWRMIDSLYYLSRKIQKRCENYFVDYRINYQSFVIYHHRNKLTHCISFLPLTQCCGCIFLQIWDQCFPQYTSLMVIKFTFDVLTQIIPVWKRCLATHMHATQKISAQKLCLLTAALSFMVFLIFISISWTFFSFSAPVFGSKSLSLTNVSSAC